MNGDVGVCQYCGREFAAVFRVKRRLALVITGVVEVVEGTACRDCGLSTARSVAARNLVGGWWGVFASVLLPFTLARNWLSMRSVRRLPAPTGTPTHVPLDPGLPLYRRRAALVPLALLTIACGVVAVGLGTRSIEDLRSGDCVDLPSEPDSRSWVDGASCREVHDAEVVGRLHPQAADTVSARCVALANGSISNPHGELTTLVLAPKARGEYDDPPAPACLVSGRTAAACGAPWSDSPKPAADQRLPPPTVGGMSASETFTPSPQTTARVAKRASLDRTAAYAVLDEGLVAHVGFVVDGAPFVIPMVYGRDGDRLLLHGSVATRLARTLADGAPVCITVTLVDGLVVARSQFHHSMNYRSVVVVGEARRSTDPADVERALEVIVDHVIPGRSAESRPGNRVENRQTSVIVVPIETASLKVRTGPPIDDPDDLPAGGWGGVLPLHTVVGEPEPDEHTGDAPVPASVAGYRRP